MVRIPERVGDGSNPRKRTQQLTGPIGRAVVDDDDLAVLGRENGLQFVHRVNDSALFVVRRDHDGEGLTRPGSSFLVAIGGAVRCFRHRWFLDILHPPEFSQSVRDLVCNTARPRSELCMDRPGVERPHRRMKRYAFRAPDATGGASRRRPVRQTRRQAEALDAQRPTRSGSPTAPTPRWRGRPGGRTMTPIPAGARADAPPPGDSAWRFANPV